MSNIPKPVGYKILCSVPEVEETFHGSVLVKPSMTTHTDKVLAVVMKVEALGPDAYDPEKFKTPWCKEGDYIVCRGYSGTRFKVDKKEYVFIYDDQVEGIVDSPEGVSR